MKYQDPKYTFPIAGSAWTHGVGQPAGVYFLEGRCHFATHDSPAARQLQERGALLVGTLRFEREALEGPAPAAAPVARLGRRTAAAWLGWGTHRN